MIYAYFVVILVVVMMLLPLLEMQTHEPFGVRRQKMLGGQV